VQRTGKSVVSKQSGAEIGRLTVDQSWELVKIMTSAITTVAVGRLDAHQKRRDTITWQAMEMTKTKEMMKTK